MPRAYEIAHNGNPKAIGLKPACGNDFRYRTLFVGFFENDLICHSVGTQGPSMQRLC